MAGGPVKRPESHVCLASQCYYPNTYARTHVLATYIDRARPGIAAHTTPTEGTKRNGFVPREIQYSGLNLNSPLRHPVCLPGNAYMARTCIDFLTKWKIGVEPFSADE